jgi:hypothetical protein
MLIINGSRLVVDQDSLNEYIYYIIVPAIGLNVYGYVEFKDIS